MYNGTSANHIIRLNTDGSRDTSFLIGSGFDGGQPREVLISPCSLQILGPINEYNGTSIGQIANISITGGLIG